MNYFFMSCHILRNEVKINLPSLNVYRKYNKFKAQRDLEFICNYFSSDYAF